MLDFIAAKIVIFFDITKIFIMEKRNRVRRAVQLVKAHYGYANQRQVANAMDIGYNYLSNIIGGTVPLSEKTLEKFRDSFGIRPEFLTGISDNPWVDEETATQLPDSSEMSYPDRITAVTNAIKGKYGYKREREICLDLGLGETYFSDLKRGKSVMRGVIKRSLAMRFGINPDYLDGKSDEIFLKGHTNIMNGSNNMNVQGNRNNVNGADTKLLKRLQDENAELRRQLETVTTQLTNAQNHIGQLLEIINSGKKEGTDE